MNVFDAIKTTLDRPASDDHAFVVKSNGEVYACYTCWHCNGRGHFFKPGGVTCATEANTC